MNFILNSKKVKSLVTSLLMLVAINIQAQTQTFSGKVLNNNQEPLPGASVSFKNLNKGTATNIDGDFSIDIPKGKHIVQVSFLGYKTIEQEVSSNQSNIIFTLISSENVLDEVLVSAVRVKADAPITHSNLTKKEIAKRNLGQDIPVLLKYLPSVTSSSDAGAGVGYTYLRVRGSDASRVNVTINGIPYNDAESQGTFWVNIGDFASSTESLQLQRGVGTSTNGSGAFGASLNILTDAVSEKANGEISNSFGSYGTRKHTVKFSTGKLNDHFELAGRLSNVSSDGYIDRAFTDLKSYFLQASYVDENTLIKAITFGGKEQTYQAWFGTPQARLDNDAEGIETFIADNFLSDSDADNLRNSDRRYNFYTYDNETDNYQQDHYQLHWNEKINKKWSTNIGLNYTKGQGFFEQFKPGESAEDFDNLIVDGSDVIVRRWLDNDFYVANANATYNTTNLEIIGGASYSNYTNDHFGEVIWGSDLAEGTNIRDRYYFSDAKKTDLSSFIKATFNIGNKFTVYADAQGRFVNYETEGLTSDREAIDVDADFNFFNPKLGLTYNLNKNNSFYASYAKANREPNRSDFEAGTTKHESLDDFELGWRLNNGAVKLSTNVYYMNYKNQLVLTGAIDDVGQAIRATSGSSYRLGVEIDADIRLNEQFSLRSNVAISDNRNRDFASSIDGVLVDLGNTPISNSSDFIAGNALVYQPCNNLQVSFLTKYVGEQYLGNLGGAVSNIEKLEDYATADFNIVYEIKMNKIFKSIVLTALVNNVFNKRYADRGYYFTFDDTWTTPGVTTTIDGAGFYPQATRNFLLGATLKF